MPDENKKDENRENNRSNRGKPELRPGTTSSGMGGIGLSPRERGELYSILKAGVKTSGRRVQPSVMPSQV